MGFFKKLFNSIDVDTVDTVDGYIGAYDLNEWWFNTFTKQEREYIVAKYSPMGLTSCTLTNGQAHINEHVSIFLANLSNWFSTKDDLNIAIRILDKAEELFSNKIRVLDRHFYYMNTLKIYYKDRSNETSLEKAIYYCNKQIELAPKAKTEFLKDNNDRLPKHTGYEQLAIIEEKRGNLDKALALSLQAKAEGWNNEWDNRIEKLQKKINK